LEGIDQSQTNPNEILSLKKAIELKKQIKKKNK
jgi:hypothetical protein